MTECYLPDLTHNCIAVR